MAQLSDIEIAQSAKLVKIKEIAQKIGISEDYIEEYGPYKAKIDLAAIRDDTDLKRLILVTAMSPSAAGEGKTTTMIGLADALKQRGKRVAVAMREPSLGPVFGIKGGAAGGGYAQALPMEDLNLHFTGDFHAIGAANNLLAAMLDNHIHQGNELGIDPRSIVWRRCLDMNDRQLRHLVDGLGNRSDGFPRQDSFDITVASEVMAVLCLADSLADLKKRLSGIVVAYDYAKKPIRVSDIKAAGAMTVLLKDAIKPNLIQTVEGTPVFVHGGPFANIAHGCNSLLATRMALSYSDYTVTEAGFGADLGAEKFFDIKCRVGELNPAAVVLVASIRALKKHGGLDPKNLAQEDLNSLKRGMANLIRHLTVLREVFGQKVVIAINRFPSDTESELNLIDQACHELGVPYALSEVWGKGGAGGLDLADRLIELAEGTESRLTYAYDLDQTIESKIEAIAQKVYKAQAVTFSKLALAKIRQAEEWGYGKLPVCMAKTQYSFSDDPKLLGAPDDFTIKVADVRLSAGAGFVVALTGNIMTMPGLPKRPAAEGMDVDDQGNIQGLM